MLPIRWRAAALDDLERLIAEIARFNLSAAEDMRDRIESVILPLSNYPYLYRAGRVPGTRELVAHPNYIVIYKVELECIEIVSILHARQRYP